MSNRPPGVLKNRFSQIFRFTTWRLIAAGFIFLTIGLFFFLPKILTAAGEFLIVETPLSPADAVVVLNTGVEYAPRLMEAASIFQAGWAGQIVVNGNRKTDIIRKLESMGYSPACHWCDDHRRIFALYDIPEDKVQCISAEDAYDTVSEAAFVGEKLLSEGRTKLIITTSKSHTGRAYRIWRDLFEGKADILMVPAGEDPFQPDAWWKSGRQVRWVLAEYGAWLYYFWKQATRPADEYAPGPARRI